MGSRYRIEDTAEELANTLTHGVGAVMSLGGLALLVALAALGGTGWHLASAIVFGVTLLLLYLASTLYHALTGTPAERLFQILDHAAIYLLIAGTYTPFTLVTLRPVGGWWLFGVVWGLATVGVVAEAAWVTRPRWVSVVIFVAMGWLVLVMRGPLVEHLRPAGLWLLVAGGVSYTVGALFYVSERRYMHAVFHLFVLGGSVLHFLAVLFFVLP